MLARHHDICQAILGMTGLSGYAPARAAVVAAHRRERAA